MNQKLFLIVSVTSALTSNLFASENCPHQKKNYELRYAIQLINHIDNYRFNTALDLLKTTHSSHLGSQERGIITRLIKHKEHEHINSILGCGLSLILMLQSIQGMIMIGCKTNSNEDSSPLSYAPHLSTLTFGASALYTSYKDMGKISSEDRKTLAEIKKLINESSDTE